MMPEEALESKMFVGRASSPIKIILRKEVLGYVDEEFMRMYNVWQKFHLGFGLPGNKGWAKTSTFIIDIIEAIEVEHRQFENNNKGA